METVAFIAAMTLGLTFLASGIGKLRDPREFVIAVVDYNVAPRTLAVVYARLLPFAEVICGILLLVGVWPTAVGVGAIGLLGSFLFGVGANLLRGRELDCHCFGSRRSEKLGWVTIARISVLILCGLAVTRGTSAPLVTSGTELFPAIFVAVAVLLSLYLLRAAPVQWSVWRTRPEPGATLRGGCVSFRNQPLGATGTTAVEGNVAIVRTGVHT